jgi:hypothetical protein
MFKDVFNSQLKLANRLKPAKKVPAMKVEVDLPISSEMIDWLEDSCHRTDDDGFLTEEISSMLTRPMDSFSMYCPTGAIVTSKFSTARIPSPVSKNRRGTGSDLLDSRAVSVSEIDLHELKANRISVSAGSTAALRNSIGSQELKPPKINDAINRLQIMWLQRRAQLENEDGEVNRAVDTLNEALKLHLGTEKYEDAKLGEAVASSDPLELLQTIGDNYIVYDVTAHRMATKIQICYHRHYTYVCNAANLVSRIYRGYLARRGVWRYKQLRIQCAQLLQHRFRVHLARMHQLATKIKQWWKVRKDVKKYQAAFRIYDLTRRIQRLFRGCQGRAKANQRRLELNMTIKIQKNTRAAIFMRRDRSFAVAMYHRLFFRAARRIQCVSRRAAAMKRSQLQLLLELAREEDRLHRERVLVTNTVKIELARTRLYYKTAAGKLHLQEAIKKITASDKYFKQNETRMSKQEILARRAVACFELHDLDGSGKLNEEELGMMMRDLCVPMTRRKIAKLAKDMDTDGSGDIDFGELLDWYCKAGDSESSAENNAFGTATMKRVLVTRQMAMEFSGRLVRRRAELEVLRQCTTWRSRDAIALFRQNEPPKYQCCQCLRPFVLFTDYYAHFDVAGKCGVTNLRAMFYDRFWLRRDWKCQREIEREVIRVNGEEPYLKYFEMMGSYEDIAIQKDPAIRTVINRHVKSSRYLFVQRFNDEKQLKVSSVVIESIGAGGVKIMTPILAGIIASGIKKSPPVEWIVKNDYQYEAAKKWIASSADAPASTMNKILRGQCLSKVHTINAARCAVLHVLLLRALLQRAKSQLVALVEYRATRKRTVSLSDAELESKQLGLLTSKQYYAIQNRLLKQIRKLQDEFEKLDAVRQPHYCLSILGPRLSRYLPVTPVENEVTPEQLRTLAVADAHARAKALWNCRLASKVGKVQQRRLANELWARRRLIWDSYGSRFVQEHSGCSTQSYYFQPNILDGFIKLGYLGTLSRWLSMNYVFPSGQWRDPSRWRSKADFEYLFSLFATVPAVMTAAAEAVVYEGGENRSPTPKSRIELEDWYELQKFLGLQIKPDSEAEKIVNAQLTETDLCQRTIITMDMLINWLEDVDHKKYHHVLRRCCAVILNLVRTMTDRYYLYHGNTTMFISARNFARVELRLLDKCNVFAAEADRLLAEEVEKAELVMAQPSVVDEQTTDHDGGKDRKGKEKEKRKKDKHKDSKDESKESKGAKEHKDKVNTVKEPLKPPKKGDDEKLSAKDKAKGKDKEAKKNGGKSNTAVSKKGETKVSARDKETKNTSGKKDSKSIKSKGNVPDGEPNAAEPAGVEDDEEEQLEEGIIGDSIIADVGINLPMSSRKKKKQSASFRPPRMVTYDESVEIPDSPDDVRTREIQQHSEKQLESEVKILSDVKAFLENAEIQLIFRMEEDNAESKCWRSMITTRRGRYCLRAETTLIAQFDSMINSYSCCVRTSSVTPFKQSWLKWYENQRKNMRVGGWEDVVLVGLDRLFQYRQADATRTEITDHVSGDVGWSLILSMFIHSFDTDCSGSFDESEVRLLLDSVLCHLSEKVILATFPEVKLDCTTCERMVDYLNTRVRWRRNWFNSAVLWLHIIGGQGENTVNISRRQRTIQAALMLISRSRQAARLLTAQAISLVRTGHLPVQDSGKNESALIVRAQVLAMRQVHMFLKTTLGRLNSYSVRDNEVVNWYNNIVVREGKYSQLSLYEYAIKLHSDGDGMLNTELPHLVNYCTTVFSFQLKDSQVHIITDSLQRLNVKKNLSLFSSKDLLALLIGLFKPIQSVSNAEISANRWNFVSFTRFRVSYIRSKLADARVRMFSLARQQAVLIAMRYRGMKFADTNYRCSVLGLESVMTELRYRDVGNFMAGMYRRDKVERRWVPKEAVTLLLLSKGYSLQDLHIDDLPVRYAGVTHADGALAAELVPVKAAIHRANKVCTRRHSYLQYYDRWARFVFGGLPKFIEYTRTVRAMTNYSDDVNGAGAHFLNEILTGISHCSVE